MELCVFMIVITNKSFKQIHFITVMILDAVRAILASFSNYYDHICLIVIYVYLM